MIHTKDFGEHKDVLFAEFGSGDIKMSRAKFIDKKHDNMLMFHNRPAHPIGQTDDEFTGKTSDEIDKPLLVMTFTRPESITALIHSLIELQKTVFDYAAENSIPDGNVQ